MNVLRAIQERIQMRLTALHVRYALIVAPGRLSTLVLHRKTQNARIVHGGTTKMIIHTHASIVLLVVAEILPLSWNASDQRSARVAALEQQKLRKNISGLFSGWLQNL